MTGIQHIEVSSKRAKFKFDIFRNITVVRGDSGTGKTTLYNMVADYTRLGDKSGVNISAEKKCVALIDIDWKNQLRQIKDSIVFIDEGAKFISTKEFADIIKNTDNYYVIFNRESLYDLPYSVEEIYWIKTSGKYHQFVKMYKESSAHLHTQKRSLKNIHFDAVLVEDSKSGFQFFCNYLNSMNIRCETSGGNSGIFKWLLENKNLNVLVIADGAAFGAEMHRIVKLQKENIENVHLYLPESFEWMILNSGIAHSPQGQLPITSILENPSIYIESEKYFSWELFFTDLLIHFTVNTPFQYKKPQINPIYLIEENVHKILAEILEFFK